MTQVLFQFILKVNVDHFAKKSIKCYAKPLYFSYIYFFAFYEFNHPCFIDLNTDLFFIYLTKTNKIIDRVIYIKVFHVLFFGINRFLFENVYSAAFIYLKSIKFLWLFSLINPSLIHTNIYYIIYLSLYIPLYISKKSSSVD